MNLIRYFDDGFRLGLLAKEGIVHNYIVILTTPIDLIKLPADDDATFEYLAGDAESARRRFLALAKTRGITQRAKQLLEKPSI